MSEEEQKHLMQSYYDLHEKYYKLKQENKQLKEELENDIDRYEDTISYQLGFDKGKEYMQQRIDKAIEYIELWHYRNDFRVNSFTKGVKEDLLEILGDKE